MHARIPAAPAALIYPHLTPAPAQFQPKGRLFRGTYGLLDCVACFLQKQALCYEKNFTGNHVLRPPERVLFLRGLGLGN
jgi:hypothetical protein